ncbi:cohesin domain-containing protein [Patescibacteria group bacterium]|nr:cohesin domain-containing protein [Patescibacteria group bacterium]
MRLPGISLIFKTIGFILVSWLLVHFLAVFGIFLVIAYPFWWLFTPQKTLCLFCEIKKLKECFFVHSLINGGIILVLSLLSFGLVFLEGRILFKMGFPPTPKTVSFVIPTKGQYRLGEIFPMKIEIAGIKTPINAIQADLSFEPQKLEVVDISTQDSFANIFIQKEINNEVGYTRLTGGLPAPGFFADRGVFGTVFFKGKSPGVVKIEFAPSSMVLANDGRGTNVLRELAAVSYLILPEKISQEEEKMQKEIVLKPVVLGTETQETQMKFYEEEKVLGAQVGQEIEKEKKFNLGKTLLEFLEKADRTILSFWGKIFFK